MFFAQVPKAICILQANAHSIFLYIRTQKNVGLFPSYRNLRSSTTLHTKQEKPTKKFVNVSNLFLSVCNWNCRSFKLPKYKQKRFIVSFNSYYLCSILSFPYSSFLWSLFLHIAKIWIFLHSKHTNQEYETQFRNVAKARNLPNQSNNCSITLESFWKNIM